MLNVYNILETIRMIQDECLDIRTITMGISLLDCCGGDIDIVCGNIYERVLDWVDRQNSLTNAVDPVGTDAEHVYRVFRGGSYNYSLADIRLPRRSAESPDRCTGYIGFRIAATIVE